MYYAEKDYEGALNYYRKASVRLADATLAIAAQFYSARCLEAMKLPSEARVTYEDIVSTKGDNPYREPSRLALAEVSPHRGARGMRWFNSRLSQRKLSSPSSKPRPWSRRASSISSWTSPIKELPISTRLLPSLR